MGKIFGLFVFLSVYCCGAMAQVNFMYTPGIQNQTLEGLGNFQIQSANPAAVKGRVVIEVAGINPLKQVAVITSRVLTLTPGIMRYSRAEFSAAGISFASNSVGAIVNQTRKFPPGDYTVCYRFVPVDKSQESENCFDFSVRPFSPLALITPLHLDTICEKRPFLSWQPPMPFSAAMRFRLLLVEKTHEQNSESIAVNTPVVLLDNITSTSVNFPAGQPGLKEGSTYVWQVVAYEGGAIVSKSEIWQFTVLCKEKPSVIPTDSYRELMYMRNANYYIANRFLKFSFTNNHNVSKLSYAIYDYQNGGKFIKKLPEVKLKTGINKVDIDLSGLGLTAGKSYMLRVFPFNESSIEIKFEYQEKDEE